jgi:hypothetical protein
MRIDLTREKLETFAQAARFMPPRRNDRPVNPITLWRWHRHGVWINGKKVHLEAVKTPSGLATTAAAVQRFISELNDRSDLAPAEGSERAAVRRAVTELDADGV